MKHSDNEIEREQHSVEAEREGICLCDLSLIILFSVLDDCLYKGH